MPYFIREIVNSEPGGTVLYYVSRRTSRGAFRITEAQRLALRALDEAESRAMPLVLFAMTAFTMIVNQFIGHTFGKAFTITFLGVAVVAAAFIRSFRRPRTQILAGAAENPIAGAKWVDIEPCGYLESASDQALRLAPAVWAVCAIWVAIQAWRSLSANGNWVDLVGYTLMMAVIVAGLAEVVREIRLRNLLRSIQATTPTGSAPSPL